MSVTKTIFLQDRPEFAEIDGTAIERQILRADNYLSDSAWGTMRDEALELLAAHRLSLLFNITAPEYRDQNTPGLRNSQNAGPSGQGIGVAHNSMATGESPHQADWSRTNYGLELLALEQAAISPAVVTGAGESTTGWGGSNRLDISEVLPQI